MEKKGVPRKEKVPELVRFGAAVRRLRDGQGYSQESFADACVIDRSYMGGIERGEHNVALINILKIIAGLGIEPSEFFKELDQPKRKRASGAPDGGQPRRGAS